MINATRAFLFAVIAGVGLAVPLGVAAEEAVTNKAVAEYLSQAKKQAGAKRWQAALAALEKARQVPGASGYAEYKIDEFRGYVLTRQRRYPEAASVFERLASSDVTPAADRTGHLKTAAQLYMEAKQYAAAARVSDSAVHRGQGSTALLELAGQANYLAGNYRVAADRIGQLLAATQRKGAEPKEEWLRIQLNSYYRLNDREHIARAWESLLRNYPKPEYWRTVLDLQNAETRPEKVELYYLALTFDVGVLDDPADYETLALGAIDLGVPAAAVRVLEGGFRAHVLKDYDARFQRMLAHARSEAAKSAASLDDLARQARRASTGEPDANVGRAYLSQGKYEQAVQALQRASHKGNLRNPEQARIDLGVAYLKSGDSERAQQAFAGVAAKSEWHDLANLWALRTNEVAARNETAQR